ncbi:metallophosphoesterase [Acidisphaera sp. S103]|uniref:metallophosphoesterase family protein n=1 Tax=Acidisphaera sp. S103 TaxID=1747223 RepID=UPI00131A90D9|nr:metallophosphoesterase [Acidisphaera sp. S103]
MEGATVFFFINSRQLATIPSTRDKDPTIEIFDHIAVVQVKVVYRTFSDDVTLSQNQNEWVCRLPAELTDAAAPPIRPPAVSTVRAELNILHITDLHCGQRSYADFYPRMRSGFFKDLELTHEHSGPWDLIIFTGDLAFSGKVEQFSRVNTFLDDLNTKLRQLGSADPVLLAIPGNHDLQRPPATKAASVVLSHLENEMLREQGRDVWDELLDNKKSEYSRLVEAMFKNYKSWWDACAARAPGLSIRQGLLPGDFTATFEKSGARFGVVGLNSTALQVGEGDFEGRLAIHVRQFNTLLNEVGLDWPETLDASILLTHQPRTWLSKDNLKNTFYPAISPGGRFALHLCGHQHVGEAEKHGRGADDAGLVALGRSLLAIEKVNGKLEHLLGYQTFRISIDRSQSSGLIRAWPRSAELTSGGSLEFGPDRSFRLGADNGTLDIPINRFVRPNLTRFPAR